MSEICRYCEKLIVDLDFVITHSYWSGLPFPAHKSCAVEGRKVEALECQTIDADCNDCRNFKRGEMVPLKPEILEQIRLGKVPNFNSGVWTGHCLKFDRPTFAYPNKWTGRECFEHRRLTSDCK